MEACHTDRASVAFPITIKGSAWLAGFPRFPLARYQGTASTASSPASSRWVSVAGPFRLPACTVAGTPAGYSAFAGCLATANCFVAGYRVASIESFDFRIKPR